MPGERNMDAKERSSSMVAERILHLEVAAETNSI